MFITPDTYVRLTNGSSTTLTIDITETPFYIKNIQSPIAKRPEILFRTLLFAFLCLEVFVMAFLFGKLILVPIHRVCLKSYNRWQTSVAPPVEPSDRDQK